MFGYVVTTSVKHIATTICDFDNSAASREPVARFVHSGYVDIVAYVRDDGYARRPLNYREVQAVLRLD